MKKLTALLIAVVLLATACDSGTEFELRDTPARIGAGILKPRVSTINFDMAVEHADLIADVTVIGWLNETVNEAENMTFFAARINTVAKDRGGANLKADDVIVVAQSGNQHNTVVDFPLFGRDERLLLFLSVHERKGYKAYSGVFEVMNMYHTPFIVHEHEGETYLLSRFDWGIARCLNDIDTLTKTHSDTAEAVRESHEAVDTFFSEVRNARSHVFAYDEVVALITR